MTEAHELLRLRMAEAGTDIEGFARLVVRDQTAVRRWLHGGVIPWTVESWLLEPPEPWPPPGAAGE